MSDFIDNFSSQVKTENENELIMKSSSDFKAIEGLDFEIFCQTSGVRKTLIEIYLPNGQQAKTNKFTTVRRGFYPGYYGLELIIKMSKRSRDQGTYSCVAQESDSNVTSTVQATIEFVDEPFLILSTPNTTFEINKEDLKPFEIKIRYASLPHPTFELIKGNDNKNLIETVQGPLGEIRFLVSNVDHSYSSEYTVVATTETHTSNVTFQLIVGGN